MNEERQRIEAIATVWKMLGPRVARWSMDCEAPSPTMLFWDEDHVEAIAFSIVSNAGDMTKLMTNAALGHLRNALDQEQC